MYMGLDTASRKYRIRPDTLKRILPFLIYRNRGKWTEINTSSLEGFCRAWAMGIYRNSDKVLLSEYITLAQAEKISGISRDSIRKAIERGKLDAIRNPVGDWLVKESDLRIWWKVKKQRRPFKYNPKYLWLMPPSERHKLLVSELLTVARTVYERSQKDPTYRMALQTLEDDLSKKTKKRMDWLSLLIHAIHMREEANRKDAEFLSKENCE